MEEEDMEKKERWMKQLKDKLANYSEPIPATGWEQLEKALARPAKKAVTPLRRWAMAAAAIALLAIVSSVSVYFLHTPVAEEMHRTATTLPDNIPTVSQPETMSEPIPSYAYLPVKKAIKEDLRVEEWEIDSMRVPYPEDTASAEPRPTPTPPYVPATRTAAQQRDTWSVGLSVGNAGGGSATINPGPQPFPARVSVADVANGLVGIPEDQKLVFDNGVPYLRQSNQIVDITHHQPISFGLSVRKNLKHGFSLETGLAYTLLSSDVQLANYDRKVEQKLHYLGIPLKANWNFVDKRRITLYVSGGGMMEKSVYASLDGEQETVKPLQFSVSGAVGAQVNATKHISLYVEPGVAYFFNDGTDVQTIRKETPFNFNMQAGLRFTY